jgi:hypothetical protein
VTTDDDAPDKTPLDHLVDQAADLFVYAPIGLFFDGPSLLPKLAEQGRVHARNARLFGQYAVRHGEAEVRRRVGGIEEQATGIMRLFGLLPDEPPDEPTAPASRAAAAVVVDEPGSTNGHAPAGPDVDELAIPDYDSLSASQVVTRLDGLTPAELEAVRAYEAANRGRKTILNKVAQLQT